MLLDLGVETSVRIDRPLLVGELLRVRCSFVDVASSTYKLEDAGAEPEPVEETGSWTAAVAA